MVQVPSWQFELEVRVKFRGASPTRRGRRKSEANHRTTTKREIRKKNTQDDQRYSLPPRCHELRPWRHKRRSSLLGLGLRIARCRLLAPALAFFGPLLNWVWGWSCLFFFVRLGLATAGAPLCHLVAVRVRGRVSGCDGHGDGDGDDVSEMVRVRVRVIVMMKVMATGMVTVRVSLPGLRPSHSP